MSKRCEISIINKEDTMKPFMSLDSGFGDAENYNRAENKDHVHYKLYKSHKLTAILMNNKGY